MVHTINYTTGGRELHRNIGLRLTNFIQRADSTYGGFIVVPVGQEKVWVDSLETFPAIITQADRVTLVPEN